MAGHLPSLPLMIKAYMLVFDPVLTWNKIAESKRGLLFVLLLHLLPLLVFTGLAEGYALMTWGKRMPEVERYVVFPAVKAWTYVGVQGLLSLLAVFGVAKLVKSVNESFHGVATYPECFTLVAYSLSALFAVRLMDVIPALGGTYSDWVSYIIGGCLLLTTFYSGTPRLLRLTPGSAFGQYMISVLLTLLIFGFVRFFALQVRAGAFQF
jgi:hypothetical protein